MCIVITVVKEEKLGKELVIRVLDVAAWEGDGVEVQRQTAVSNGEGMLKPGSGRPGSRTALLAECRQ